MSREEALSEARAQGLDLVEISPAADPPVAKIVNWGKYLYHKTKEDRKTRFRNRTDLKEMRLGLKISAHDLEVKLKKVRQFLEAGHKVRLTVRYRGREMAHRDLGYDLLKRITQLLGERIVIDQSATMFGKQLNMTVRYSSAKAQDPPGHSQTNPSERD